MLGTESCILRVCVCVVLLQMNSWGGCMFSHCQQKGLVSGSPEKKW